MYVPKLIYTVNEQDEIIGTIKDDFFSTKIITRGSSVLVFNKKGELFLQKRSKNKFRYPLHWDSSACGVVDEGETYESTAINELKEELGLIKTTKELEFLGKEKIISDKEEFEAIYKIQSEGPFKLLENEICEGKFFNIEEIKKMIKKEEKFSPVFLEIFKRKII